MLLNLKSAVTLINADTGKNQVIEPGQHECERIANPLDPAEDPWLVLMGTKVGASEGWWKGITKIPEGE